jgi:DnaJ-class molecular chaperone
MDNHYKTLGVRTKADSQEIKDQYRSLSKKYHPDKEGGNAEKFKKIASAYEVLSDTNRRAFYDRTGSDVTEKEYDTKAGGLLQQVFQLIVSKNGLEKIIQMDMIARIKENLDMGMIDLSKKTDTARKSRAAIGRVLKRLKHKDKRNPISSMLKVEIQNHSNAILKIKHEQRVGERAIEMLTGYEFDFVKAQSVTLDQWTSQYLSVNYTGTTS